MASNNHQQKISPRKFSEKIALLNKKEAETNAKFEEIIKEVQETTHRSTSSCGHHKFHQQPTANKLDEQLTEGGADDFSVNYGQWNGYHQCQQPAADNLTTGAPFVELPDNRQYDGRLIDESMTECCDTVDSSPDGNENDYDEEEDECPIDQFSEVSVIPGQDSIDAIEIDKNECLNLFESMNEADDHQQKGILLDSQPFNEPPNEFQGSTHDLQTKQVAGCRTRVTSVGSSVDYRCTVDQSLGMQTRSGANEYGCHDVSWSRSSEIVYLEPVYDEKSWQKSSSDPSLHNSINITTTNNNTNNNLAPQQTVMPQISCSDSNISQQESNFLQDNKYQLATTNSNNNNNLWLDQSKRQKHVHQQTIQETFANQHHSSAISIHLPGIQICNIDEEASKSLKVKATAAQQGYQVSSEARDLGIHHSIGGGCQVIYKSHQQASDRQQQEPCRWPATTNQPTGYFVPESQQTIGGQTMGRSNGLSGSEQGLPCSQHLATVCGTGPEHLADYYAGGSSMMRSQSHSSIYFLGRQPSQQRYVTQADVSTGYIYGGYQVPTSHQFQMMAAAGQRQVCQLSGSSNSMRPQRGSLSPLNSSASNLTSPQSEQNSPATEASTEAMASLLTPLGTAVSIEPINYLDSSVLVCQGDSLPSDSCQAGSGPMQLVRRPVDKARQQQDQLMALVGRESLGPMD